MYRFLAVPILFSLTAISAFAAADGGLLALVPSNAKLVSSVNVRQAINSPFGQFLLSKTNSDGNGFEKMIQQTGFDPRHDLESFVFASSGPTSSSDQGGFVIVARGNFDAHRIREQMLSHGGATLNAGGVEVYTGPEHGHDAHQSAFALPETGIAVFGDLASVKEVIANRNTASVLDPTLEGLIEKVSADNDAWFASVLPGSYLSRHIPEAANQAKPQEQALQSVRQAAGGVQFSDPIQFTFDAVTRSPQDAVSLTDVVRFMASLVQMQRQNDPHAQVLASALDNMSVNASGNHFHASLAIPEKSLEQLADAGPHHHGFKFATPSQK